MFENFSLADLGQRAGWDITVREKGWQKPFAIPTAEAIVWRKFDHGYFPSNYEFAVARRVGGAPECVGMRQLKWGTVIFPADATPAAALMRCMAKDFRMTVPPECCIPVGTVGPWLYRSTLALDDRQLTLTIVNEQAEKETPFFASLFHVNVTELKQWRVSPAVTDFEWVGFYPLIARYGASTDCIYWQMFFMAMEQLTGQSKAENFFARTWEPGTYTVVI